MFGGASYTKGQKFITTANVDCVKLEARRDQLMKEKSVGKPVALAMALAEMGIDIKDAKPVGFQCGNCDKYDTVLLKSESFIMSRPKSLMIAAKDCILLKSESFIMSRPKSLMIAAKDCIAVHGDDNGGEVSHELRIRRCLEGLTKYEKQEVHDIVKKIVEFDTELVRLTKLIKAKKVKVTIIPYQKYGIKQIISSKKHVVEPIGA